MRTVLRIDYHWGDEYWPNGEYRGYRRRSWKVDIPEPWSATDRDGYEVVE